MYWLILLVCLLASPVWGANYYCGPTATGDGNGGDWSNRCDFDTTTPARGTAGNTYYLAEGTYAAKTFSRATDGTKLITIKKCGSGDGVCELADGYSAADHDEQAVFGNIVFSTDYWTLDGNGTHTVPSRNTNDYGIKISTNLQVSTTRTIALSGTNNVTLRYVHSYNVGQGGTCDYTGSHRNVYMVGGSNIKIQNCYVQNSFTDGVLIQNVTNVLIERSYFEGLGLLPACSPDYHGQAMRIWSDTDVVIRWNIFRDNDGQGIIALANDTPTGHLTRVRIYGNVLYNANKDGDLYLGPNGGMIDYYGGYLEDLYIYNNTIANVRDEYPGAWTSISIILLREDEQQHSGNIVAYNNLFYNCYMSAGADLTSGDFTAHSHDAYGETLGDSGGTSEQSGITSSYFMAYNEETLNFDFRLTQATQAGKTLTAETWWDTSDAFFGYLDSALDMYGNTRGSDGTWDRGAYEFVGTGSGSRGISFSGGGVSFR